MTDETVIEKPERVLELARERHAAGESMRGLPRPAALPSGGWYSVQVRKLKTGGELVPYLMWRWRDPETDRQKAHSLGRLN